MLSRHYSKEIKMSINILEQIGYSLIDTTGKELQCWGENIHQCQPIPDIIILSNGDNVHCPITNVLFSGGSQLVQRWASYISPDPDSLENNRVITFDGTKIIVNITYNPPLLSKKATEQLSISD